MKGVRYLQWHHRISSIGSHRTRLYQQKRSQLTFWPVRSKEEHSTLVRQNLNGIILFSRWGLDNCFPKQREIKVFVQHVWLYWLYQCVAVSLWILGMGFLNVQRFLQNSIRSFRWAVYRRCLMPLESSPDVTTRTVVTTRSYGSSISFDLVEMRNVLSMVNCCRQLTTCELRHKKEEILREWKITWCNDVKRKSRRLYGKAWFNNDSFLVR